ncbi:MAG: 50S ribosomal protein L1 [archaeon]
MQKSEIIEALNKAKAESPKRKFKQSVDLVINLTGVDLKKSEHQIDNFVQLHYSPGKKMRVCALVGPEMKEQAESGVDKAVLADEFDNYAKDKKLTKKLASEYDYFIGQANIMPKIATAFGRVLGSRGKMPNPKAGLIVPPNANLKQLCEKLQKTIRIRAKTAPTVQALVGKEDMPDEELADNAMMIYTSVIGLTPNGEHSIKSVFLKLTMGKPVRVR